MTLPNKTDEEIVAQITRGDSDAYGLLMERYEAKLLHYVTYLIHDPTSARDVVQETFIKAYRNLQGFNPKYKFSSWVYRIAHNEAMNVIQKYKRQSDVDIDELPVVTYEPSFAEHIDASILRGHVHECINELEQKYRDVVQLVYFEQMKYEEVADVLHIPPSTVGVWLSRAKAKLRSICEEKGVKR